METNQNEYNQFCNLIRKIVKEELKNNNLLTGDWHLGKVESIVSTSPPVLSVLVDGSTIAQKIAYNPTITFTPGQEIFVLFINGDSKNKFALCPRGI